MIKVEIKSEVGISREPAKVLVYENNCLVAEVIAKIELLQGADGNYYNCIALNKRELPLPVAV